MIPIYISGLAQGDDPAGGVSVARCLRQAFENLRLIGVDYSVRAAGLHDDVFDDVVIHRPWGEFDTASLKAEFEQRFAEGASYLPTIDLEAYWLARHFPETSRVLGPSIPIFSAIAKPTTAAPALDGLCRPASAMVVEGEEAMHAFLRRIGFDAWLKGPFHDALRIRSWEALPGAQARLRKYWPFEGLHLQEHVHGTAEAIAFSAWCGELLDAIWIQKNDTTADGKTVAGSPLRMSPADENALRAYIAEQNWSGGGEIELIRGADGRISLIEVNARFPAWVEGAAILGHNLPARLLAAARDDLELAAPWHRQAGGFVRVQKEVPIRDGYLPLEPLVLNPDEPLDAAKTAFSIHEIADHLKGTVGLPVLPETVPTEGVEIPPSLPPAKPADVTPVRHFIDAVVRDRIADALSTIKEADARVGVQAPSVQLVYSMKTNPDPKVLELCREAGIGVDVISQGELDTAFEFGFNPSRIVMNGPAKPGDAVRSLVRSGGTVFADSIEELSARLPYLHETGSEVGVRIRPPGMNSRFGVPIEEPWALHHLLELVSNLDQGQCVGLQVHVAHALVGTCAWRSIVRELLEFAIDIDRTGPGQVVTLDLGGGFYPNDLLDELDWISSTYRQECMSALPDLQRLIVEPGRAFVQDAFALECRILEVRRATRAAGGWVWDIIMDASVAELSEAKHFPHRLAVLREQGNGVCWKPIKEGGADRILGRTCMEDDVVAWQVDLQDIVVGDRVLVLDAGSYDRSMTYDFGKGRYCEA